MMVVSLVQWKISYIRLQHKGYQNKTVGLIENGSWAPLANKVMKEMLTPMKNVTICENRSQLNLLIKMKIKRQLINLLKKYVQIKKSAIVFYMIFPSK